MAAFTYSTQGTAEKKTAAKLEKLRKEKPEEVENLLKTVNVPTTGPPNRSQWRKLELAMKFINKSKGPHDGPGGPNSPSKTSSRPGTPNRKSITSIESKDLPDKLMCTKPILAKQATLVAMGKSGSGDSGKLTSSAPTTAAVGTSTATTAAGDSAPQSPKLSLSIKSQQRPKSAIVVSSTVSVTKTNPESGLSSPKLKPKTSTVETNTETVSNKEAKISEVQTDANAKVLLSKKTQTDITTVSVKDDDDFPEVNASKVSPRSPRNKKKPLKKQKSLSKITNSFGKIV